MRSCVDLSQDRGAPAPEIATQSMRAMVLRRPGEWLVMEERPDPTPGPGQIWVRIEACGVCRTDLHIVDGELPDPKLPIVPGHEIVGRVEAKGEGVDIELEARVGVAWLGHACGHCPYCLSARENLCDAPLFTGYTRDGGYATHAIAEAAFVFALPEALDPVATAPLLCAGLIGWRSLKMAGDGGRSASMASAPRPISSPRSAVGRDGAYSPSPGRTTPPVRRSPARSGPNGRAARTTSRPSRSTPPFCSRRSARLFRARSPPCARAGRSSAAAST